MVIQTTNRHRPGVTLTEVLIATGIMAIGMTAILALFPIGAVNMARAINQDRTATHAMNSDNLFRVYWKRAWIERNLVTGEPTATVVQNTEAAFQYSLEPMIPLLEAHPTYGHMFGNWTLPDGLPPAGWQYPTANAEPSYPVLVDPIGYLTNAGTPRQGFVAGNRQLPVRTTLRAAFNDAPPLPAGVISRVSPDPRADFATRQQQLGYFTNYPAPFTAPRTLTVPVPPFPPAAATWVPNIPQVVRHTTLLDDLSFDTAGEPDAATGQIERGGRYTVAWLIQRASNANPSEVNISVLAFSGRAPTDTPSEEYQYTFAAQVPDKVGTRDIVIDTTNQPVPPLRRGGFIALSFQVNRELATQPGATRPTFDFYRVVSINDDNPNAIAVELETPFRRYDAAPQPAGTLTGVAVVFDNLFEVYDRGTVSATSNVIP